MKLYKFLVAFIFLLSTLHTDAAEPKRILITGGAGFLGSHLCDRCIADGHFVVCSDNLFTGSLDNIRHLIDHPNFVFINHDNCDPFDPSLEVDEIYNMACPASPVYYQISPVKTIKTCVLGAINVLELARRCHAKVFQASTSEVYGDPLEHPQKETYWGHVNPNGLRSCYDEGKRCAETLFFDYHREFGVRIKVGRIFNTYGPRMRPDDGRVVSNFIVQALAGKPLTMYGTGQQTRSFCYVSDLVEAIVALMNTPEGVSGPVNLGNPVEFTMLELAQKVKLFTESNSPIEFNPLPSDDPQRRKPNITLARDLLNWEPKVALEEGIKETAAYFKKSLE